MVNTNDSGESRDNGVETPSANGVPTGRELRRAWLSRITITVDSDQWDGIAPPDNSGWTVVEKRKLKWPYN